MIREAACQCGQLVLACSGEPAAVSLCHCLDCQRRTGSAFGIGAFFPRAGLTVVKGAATRYTRQGASLATVTFHFCGTCGSTLWWEPERLPSMAGVAIGAFADPDFPAPTQATWDKRRHRWLCLPAAMARHTEGVAPPITR